jgi:hypothetical protein
MQTPLALSSRVDGALVTNGRAKHDQDEKWHAL